MPSQSTASAATQTKKRQAESETVRKLRDVMLEPFLVVCEAQRGNGVRLSAREAMRKEWIDAALATRDAPAPVTDAGRAEPTTSRPGGAA